MAAPGKRRYVIVHEQFLMEFLMKHFPVGTFRTNVRVGMPHPEVARVAVSEAERRMLAITLFSADAVVVLPDKVVIVEALVRPEWWKVFQLELYGELFPMTEEFREHWHKPRELWVVSAVTNPFVETIARRRGVRWIHYRPAWVEVYLQGLAHRKRVAPTVALPKEWTEQGGE